jgi:hypothetical protein
VAAVLVLVATFTSQPVLITGLVMAVTLAASLVVAARTLPAGSSAG